MYSRVSENVSRRKFLAGVGTGLSTLFIGTGSAMFSPQSLPEDTPTIIGHRGAAGLAPPNTRAAIQKAVQFEVDGVELDVRQTKDGELVLFHDPVLDISTNNSGIVSETSAEIVLDAEVHGHTMLSLEEGLDIVRDSEIDLYIELKQSGYTMKAIEAIKNAGLIQRTTVVSFEPSVVQTALQSEEPIRVGLLGSAPDPTLVSQATELGVDTVLAHYIPRATPVFIEEAKEAGLTAGIWSLIDTEHSIRDALESEPDILTTNRPDLVLNTLSHKN